MKILIITKNWLGDTLFQFPAIEAVHRRWPEAQITCAAPARCRPLLIAHPAIDRVLDFDEKTTHRSFWRKAGFMLEMRREGYDKVFLFHKSRTRALLTWLAGIPERIGYAAGRSWLLTQACQEPDKTLHQVDYFLSLLERSGFDTVHNRDYCFYYSEKAKLAESNLLSRCGLTALGYVCFHLGANWEPKRWPVEHYAALADAIHRRWKMPVVVTGAAGDYPLLEDLKSKVRQARLIGLTGETGLDELGALFEDARCLITGDSGPMHIASGVGCPVVALFGPTDPARTGPRGISEKKILTFVPEGCQTPWFGNELPPGGWLSGIQPETVMGALEASGWLDPLQTPGQRALHLSNRAGKKTPDGPDMKEILVVTLSNIGDVILTTPVLMAMAARYPQARVSVVCGPRACGILEGSRYIHRLMIYDKRAGLWQQLRFLKELRKTAYDCVIDLRNTAIPFLVRAKKRSPLLRRFRSESMRCRHLEVLEMMGLEIADRSRFDFFDDRQERTLEEKLRALGVEARQDFILVSPAAASELKTWPLAEFERLLPKLLAEYSAPILLIGDQREGEIAKPLEAIERKRIINVAGKLTLRETAALISRAALLIANDSALMHLGFELGRPVVALFGPTDPSRYGQAGARIRLLRSPDLPQHPGKTVHRGDRDYFFSGLKADTVFEACKEVCRETVSSC